MTLKEYIQTLPKDRVQLAATDIDEAAKIEQEHSALDDAVFDNADLKTKSENVATDEAQNPYSFDIADEADAKKFLKGMEVSHPQLANRLRRDVRAWDEMLALDQKNSARMRRDGGIKFTGDDAEDFDFYRWAYGRGMTQSDTSFSGLLAAAGRGLWSVTKGAGKLAVTATKAAATDNAAAQMELAATAVDSAQSAVSEYQQLGAGIAALTIGDDPQLKMAAMYELAKFSDEEQKNHNAWRKAISDSFAEVPVDEDSVNALSEAFDITTLFGAGAGRLVTRGIKRVGAGNVAEVLGKSRKMLGSELAAKAMSKVPVLGAPYKRAILSGQVDALSTETQLAFKELAESKSRLASLQGTLAQNPSWSLRDPMVKQIAAQEALVAEKQGAFDLINGQLNARRGEVTESLNLAGRGLLNRAAAGTLDVAGAAVENTGKTLTRARRGLSELLTGEADDQIVGGVADAATGGFASKGNVITRMGQDVRVAAATMKQNGASIPYFRRLNQDADATKLTRNAAAFMDKSHIAWALDKSKDLGLAGLAGAPLSGAFGYVASGGDLNAAAESAGGGMAFGIGGGAYGQWEAYKDPNYRYQELLANRRQFRDTLSSRETNGQSQLQIFDQLDAGEQIALASYAQGSPDVVFRLINEPGVASGVYNRENNVVVINRASKTPVEDIFRHEVAHFVERHGLEAQVREMYLGDAEKGVIGQYTEIDRLGNPSFDESTGPDGEKKYTYRLNAEGQKLKAEYENKVRAFDPAFTMSNDYFASELFAEQYADRIFRGGLRRDLGRNAVDSVVDSLANVPLLKQFMGQIGLLFDQNDNVVGTGVFTGLKSNPEVNKLISRFNVDVSKGRAAKMQDAPDQHVLSEKELRDPVVATKWLQSGGSVRFGADGKPVYKKDGTPQFLTEKEADAEQRDLANALIAEIEKYTAANIDDADMLQRRELTDINGRKSVVYTGRRIPMAVIDAIEAQKKFNPHQLAHLRAMSASVEKHGVGAMIAHFYQAASSKLGGKSYKTVGGRWRRDGIVGFQITKDGNVLINSVSWEQLAENARKAAKTKLAREVYATSGASIETAITADVKQYLENLIDGKSGAEGIGEDRKNFINNLLGIRMASNVMLKDNGSGVLESANPLFETTDAPKTILTNLRLDRMNRVSPLDSVEYAWGPQQYRRAKMNLRPDTVEGEGSAPEEFNKKLRKSIFDRIQNNPKSDYAEGDTLYTSAGTAVKFVSDLLTEKGGKNDGAQRAYVRFPDGSEGSVFLSKLSPEKPEIASSGDRNTGPNIEFAVPPSDDEAKAALSSDRQPKYGLARGLEAGTFVGLRIDIPAFQRTGKYVVAVHEQAEGKSVGKVIGYDNVVTVDNPSFMSNETGAMKIRDGEKNKFPIATVEGAFNPSREIPQDINDWTAVGFDPKDHSYFYDKTTDQPVVGGKQAISVGNSVFVKDPMYGDRSQFQYRPEDTNANAPALGSEDHFRAIDFLGKKDAPQTEQSVRTLKHPLNPNPDSVTLVPRWGLVNRNIVGMPRGFGEVTGIVNRVEKRLRAVMVDRPEFAKESARFYRDMAESSLSMVDVIFPEEKNLSVYDHADLMLRFLALGSPRTDVAGNSTKSSGSAAGAGSGFSPGYKLGFTSQQRGAQDTFAAWRKKGHFDLENTSGVDDKVRSFYLNGIAELIEIAAERNDSEAVEILTMRAGRSLNLVESDASKFTPELKKEIDRHLDGKATVDMWDMAGKGFAWPGFILRKSERNSAKQPFQWSQDKFSKTATIGDNAWSTVLKDLGVSSPGDLRYQQARALQIDGNVDWTEKTWADRVKQEFSPETKFTYFTQGTEAGLSPGGGGPMYDAQQAIDGLVADRLNADGLAPAFGKTKLKARNSQEILWALEKLDNPIESNNDLALFGNTFKSLSEEIANLRLGKDVTKKSRAESVLAAMDRAYTAMAMQQLPFEVVTSGKSTNADLIRGKMEQLASAGVADPASVLTDHVAEGLGDKINDLATTHGLNITVDRVVRGQGGYTEGDSVSTAPNTNLIVRGDVESISNLNEVIARALDQDGANVMRKPTVRELNDIRVKKNTVVTFDTRQLSSTQRDAFFMDLSNLRDAKGDRFLTGFTETSDGISIGDQFYGGDMTVEILSNKDSIRAILDAHKVPGFRSELMIVDTFSRGTPETGLSETPFAKDLTAHLHERVKTVGMKGAKQFPQKTDIPALLENRTKFGVSQPARNKTARTAALVDLASAVDAAVLRGELDEDTAASIKSMIPKL